MLDHVKFYKTLDVKVDLTISKGTVAFQCNKWLKQIVKVVEAYNSFGKMYCSRTTLPDHTVKEVTTVCSTYYLYNRHKGAEPPWATRENIIVNSYCFYKYDIWI